MPVKLTFLNKRTRDVTTGCSFPTDFLLGTAVPNVAWRLCAKKRRKLRLLAHRRRVVPKLVQSLLCKRRQPTLTNRQNKLQQSRLLALNIINVVVNTVTMTPRL